MSLNHAGQIAIGQMANQSDLTANVMPSNMTAGMANSTDSTTTCKTDFLSTACKVEQQLKALKPDEVEGYGLTDYAPDVIKSALSVLDRGNLTKVMLNLPENELSQLREKLTSEVFNNTLRFVPEPQRTEIINRASK
jgi:hypothetical protein